MTLMYVRVVFCLSAYTVSFPRKRMFSVALLKTKIHLINFNKSSMTHDFTDLHVKLAFYGGTKEHRWKGGGMGQVLQTAVWTMGRGDTWGGATRVAPPTPNSIGLYGKSYWCRPEHVHSFVYDFVKLIWPYYRNIMC